MGGPLVWGPGQFAPVAPPLDTPANSQNICFEIKHLTSENLSSTYIMNPSHTEIFHNVMI